MHYKLGYLFRALLFCNNSSSLLYFKNIYCRGSCNFLAYAPPDQREEFFYACPLEVKFVQNCPPQYNQWSLSKDCENLPTSFVYDNDIIYRNAHCAICHLGDKITFSKLFSPFSYSVTDLSEAIPRIGPKEPSSNHIIKFSYESNECCGTCSYLQDEQCVTVRNRRVWGEITSPVDNECLKVPFSTSCGMPFRNVTSVSYNNLDYSYLCPGRPIECRIMTTTSRTPTFTFGSKRIGFGGQPGRANGNIESQSTNVNTNGNFEDGINTRNNNRNSQNGNAGGDDRNMEKVPIQHLFSHNPQQEEPEVEIFQTEHRITANETFQFCTDRTILSNSSGGSFNKVYLSSAGIQVNANTLAFL